MKIIKNKFLLVVFVLLVLARASASAAIAYPSKPIQLIVPYPAGGSTDIVARIVADRLGQLLKQPVIVENRAGASGVIGMQAAMRAAADGYTLVMGTTTNLSILAGLKKDLPYQTIRDFAPVALIATFPNVLVVNPSQPARNIRELLTYAKSNPGKITYASAGSGTTQHLSTALLMMMAAVDMVHVPYKGSGPALTDVIAGHVNLFIDNFPSAIPFVRSGNLRALAVTGMKRSSLLPNVPTVGESVPGFESTIGFGILAPKGTPVEIVERLNATIAEVASKQEVVDRITQLGGEMALGSSSAYREYIRAETEKWSNVIDKAKITLD